MELLGHTVASIWVSVNTGIWEIWVQQSEQLHSYRCKHNPLCAWNQTASEVTCGQDQCCFLTCNILCIFCFVWSISAGGRLFWHRPWLQQDQASMSSMWKYFLSFILKFMPLAWCSHANWMCCLYSNWAFGPIHMTSASEHSYTLLAWDSQCVSNSFRLASAANRTQDCSSRSRLADFTRWPPTC